VKIIYRISDGSHKKDKLPNATKQHCLENACKVFSGADLRILADNCGADTLQWLGRIGAPVEQTSLGNAGTFRFALKLATESMTDEDIVYFLEDDYLHLPLAPKAIEEGLTIADYVTLYDHPDKYWNRADGGPNPLVRHGGERSRVLLTPSTHWKLTNSTTMTFAARVRVLREDLPVWMRYTRTRIPHDFWAFRHLLWGRRWTSLFLREGRRLVSPIPALATHAELAYLAPLVDWSRV
jgi:hypothetical protein